jgi:hypothetical protein
MPIDENPVFGLSRSLAGKGRDNCWIWGEDVVPGHHGSPSSSAAGINLLSPGHHHLHDQPFVPLRVHPILAADQLPVAFGQSRNSPRRVSLLPVGIER